MKTQKHLGFTMSAWYFICALVLISTAEGVFALPDEFKEFTVAIERPIYVYTRHYRQPIVFNPGAIPLAGSKQQLNSSSPEIAAIYYLSYFIKGNADFAVNPGQKGILKPIVGNGDSESFGVAIDSRTILVELKEQVAGPNAVKYVLYSILVSDSGKTIYSGILGFQQDSGWQIIDVNDDPIAILLLDRFIDG